MANALRITAAATGATFTTSTESGVLIKFVNGSAEVTDKAEWQSVKDFAAGAGANLIDSITEVDLAKEALEAAQAKAAAAKAELEAVEAAQAAEAKLLAAKAAVTK